MAMKVFTIKMTQNFSRMRPSAVYGVGALVLTSFVALLFIQHAGWSMQTSMMDDDVYDVVMTEDRFIKQNVPTNAAAYIDINDFISSQPHYKKLCELDRYKCIYKDKFYNRVYIY